MESTDRITYAASVALAVIGSALAIWGFITTLGEGWPAAAGLFIAAAATLTAAALVALVSGERIAAFAWALVACLNGIVALAIYGAQAAHWL